MEETMGYLTNCKIGIWQLEYGWVIDSDRRAGGHVLLYNEHVLLWADVVQVAKLLFAN